MKGFFIFILFALIFAGGYYMWSKGKLPIAKASNVVFSGDEIIVDLADIEGRFSSSWEFKGKFMIFGGAMINQKDALTPATIAGLPLDQAKNIYRTYPDFDRCDSPGASLAKPLVQELDMIPSDSDVLAIIKSAISDSNKNIRQGGDRVCIALLGKNLELKSVKIKRDERNITNLYGRNEFYLVSSANMINCKEYLEQR